MDLCFTGKVTQKWCPVISTMENICNTTWHVDYEHCVAIWKLTDYVQDLVNFPTFVLTYRSGSIVSMFFPPHFFSDKHNVKGNPHALEYRCHVCFCLPSHFATTLPELPAYDNFLRSLSFVSEHRTVFLILPMYGSNLTVNTITSIWICKHFHSRFVFHYCLTTFWVASLFPLFSFPVNSTFANVRPTTLLSQMLKFKVKVTQGSWFNNLNKQSPMLIPAERVWLGMVWLTWIHHFFNKSLWSCDHGDKIMWHV